LPFPKTNQPETNQPDQILNTTKKYPFQSLYRLNNSRVSPRLYYNTLTGRPGHRVSLAYFSALPAPTLSKFDTPLPDLFEPFRKVRLCPSDASFRRFRRVEGGGRNCFGGLFQLMGPTGSTPPLHCGHVTVIAGMLTSQFEHYLFPLHCGYLLSFQGC